MIDGIRYALHRPRRRLRRRRHGVLLTVVDLALWFWAYRLLRSGYS